MAEQKMAHIYGLGGSLRKEAFSSTVLKTLSDALAPMAVMETGNVGSLPLYNQDEDGAKSPSAVVAMRQTIQDSDGLVLVSPEYNYGMPGVVKNAIDWLSRPAYKSCLVGKPFIIITTSPAFTGGVRAQAQIRDALMAALARPVETAEIVIGSVHTKIADGKLTDQASLDFAIKAIHQLIDEAIKPLRTKLCA